MPKKNLNSTNRKINSVESNIMLNNYSSPEFNTPMMQQYLSLKQKYSDCILLFRLGDFYEMFLDDAKLGAQILDITLTSRDRGKDGRIPMCGVPFHAIDAYLPKLVRAGHKVAICEQIGDTRGPKLVEREVVRIVTPGTLLGEHSLDKKENNYIMSFHKDDEKFAVAIADLSTGLFYSSEYVIEDLEKFVINEISKFNLSECILAADVYNDPKILSLLKSHKDINIFPFFEFETYYSDADKFLMDHFSIKSLEPYGLHNNSHAQIASAALLGYLKFTQKNNLNHIKNILSITNDEYMSLDRSTIFNLEIFSTVREQNKKGSLYNFFDKTITACGGRMLRHWMLNPLINKTSIEKRYEVIELILSDPNLKFFLTERLEMISDIERILSRLSVGLGNPRDLVNLKESLINIILLKKELKNIRTLEYFSKKIDEKIEVLINVLDTSLLENPPLDPKNGGFISNSVDAQLDTLRSKVKDSKIFIEKLEQKEREKTKINSLKVKFNQIFGYYIEISKSNLHMVPTEYMRKQTLVNAERFITPELKEHEEIILTAEEKINNIEYELFLKIVEDTLKYTDEIQRAANSIGQLDCLLTFVQISEENKFVRPLLTDDGDISITDGWHPVVSQILPRGEFIKNDTNLDIHENQLLIITGPNMGGKSVYIRQTALITLIAQMGCFVPAKSAKLAVVDKLFVRSGAADAITGGLSTFMVEMVETAYILNNATDKSLIVMDEIGRGTSTYDGISIAWAIAEFLVTNNKFRPKTLFATHYHELEKLEDSYTKSIKNYQVIVDNSGDKPVFLHKVVRGAAEHSFGIQVARQAGVIEEVCIKASQVLSKLVTKNSEISVVSSAQITSSNLPVPQLPLIEIINTSLDAKNFDTLRNIDISQTTPLEALNILADLKKTWSQYFNE